MERGEGLTDSRSLEGAGQKHSLTKQPEGVREGRDHASASVQVHTHDGSSCPEQPRCGADKGKWPLMFCKTNRREDNKARDSF